MPHSSLLVQSSQGDPGNFELVLPRQTGGGVCRMSRDNTTAALPWSAPQLLFGSAEDITSACVVENRGNGRLEVAGIQNGSIFHASRSDASDGRWTQPVFFAKTTGVKGHPGFIQGGGGANGNLEVVAAHAAGGLVHWWRDNESDLEWRGPNPFGAGDYEAVALIQSNFGSPGNLEVIARTGNRLEFYFFDSQWNGPLPIGEGAAGAHCLLQRRGGGFPDFELVAPMEDGGLGWWTRHNDRDGLPWTGPVKFGSGQYLAVGLIESSFGGVDRLEVTALTGETIDHFFLDDNGEWQGPTAFPHTAQHDPSTHGRTSVLPQSPGHVGVHAILLRTGKVLLFGYADTNDVDPKASVWDPDPANPAPFTSVDPHHVFFCSGHSSLPDGRIFLAAGHHGRRLLSFFDPGNITWSHPKNGNNEMTMAVDRWYPTCTTLPDGRVMIFSGNAGFAARVQNNFQLFTANPPFLGPIVPVPEPLSEAFAPPNPNPGMALYPYVYVLPDGKVMVYSHRAAKFFDLNSQRWDDEDVVINSPFSRSYIGAGTSVLLPLQPPDYRAKVLVTGGSGVPLDVIDTLSPARADAEILDTWVTPRQWRFIAPMRFARVLLDSVLLPDGKVLVLGGSASGRADQGAAPVLDMEIFDPATETWTTVCQKILPHMYHSTAVLLPDGRVAMMGKDGLFQLNPFRYPERRIEVYEPPYLFKGPRPEITSVPGVVGYGQQFDAGTGDGFDIASACLMRPGATTHSNNMDQRYVGLEISNVDSGSLTLLTPPSANVAPPGFYMLFLVSHAGVPSVAKFVQLG